MRLLVPLLIGVLNSFTPQNTSSRISRYILVSFVTPTRDAVKEFLVKGPEMKLPEFARISGYFTAFTLTSLAITLAVPDGRNKLKKRWEVFTSPNHADPLNQGPFHFRTLEEEKNQSCQGDKGVHFLTAYTLVNPLSVFMEYFLQVTGVNSPGNHVTERAFWLAVLGDFLFGFSEEYVDAFEKDEGFSIPDMIANLCGLGFAILKKYGYLKDVDFMWAIHRPPSSWKYHFWLNMPSYEFTLRLDLSRYVFGRRYDWKLFKWWREYVGYVGSTRFLLRNMYEETPEWRRVGD